MKSLGAVIEEAIRGIPKMSLRKLEMLAGVTRSEISLIIHRKRKRPTPRVLRKIAGPLKLNYTYLYSLAGYLDEADYRRIARAKKTKDAAEDLLRESRPPYPGLSRKKEEILTMLRDLPDSEMEEVREYLKLIRLKVKENKKRQGETS